MAQFVPGMHQDLKAKANSARESQRLLVPFKSEIQKPLDSTGVIPLARIRSRSEIGLSFAQRAGRTRAIETYQAGCLRVRVLNNEIEVGPCAVVLNTGGGVLGGDHLRQSVLWGEGAQALVTNQAAEKVYRALDEAATIETTLNVEAGAIAEWLPQETILFNNVRLARNTRVQLSGVSSFLGLEALVFGRAAMNEAVETGEVRDAWRIYRDGKLIFADVLHFKGAVREMLMRNAIAAGARACAVIIFVAKSAASLLPKLREALALGQSRSAASAWNGMLVARFLAPDSETLKRDIVSALNVLRGDRDLPRVWSC